MCDKPKVDTSAQDAQAREAERARQEQIAREARIRKGERDIRNIFEGRALSGRIWKRQRSPSIALRFHLFPEMLLFNSKAGAMDL